MNTHYDLIFKKDETRLQLTPSEEAVLPLGFFGLA